MRNNPALPAPAPRRASVIPPLRGLVQLGSFVAKELAEVRRQPKLVLSLIAGPFLLLFLFGVGYSPQPPRLQTLVVVPPNSPYREAIEARKGVFGEPFVLVGITDNAAEARAKLDRREIGGVIYFPDDPYAAVLRGEYSPLLLEFNEIDPIRSQWISYYGYVQTNELNKRLLVEALKSNEKTNGQGRAAALRQSATTLREQSGGLRQAAAGGDRAGVATRATAMQAENIRLQQELLNVGQLYGAVAVLGDVNDPQESPVGRDLITAQEGTARIADNLNQLQQATAQGQLGDRERGLAEGIERDSATVQDATSRLNFPPAEVIVSPFEPKSRDVASLEPNFVTYYSPGVIALLAQHIAVTLSALTLVRERLLGTVEVLRVAPIGVWSIAWGKYLSHFTLTAVLAAALTAALHFGLGIPILGGWGFYALSLGLLIAAALSLGFFISAVASSESQAVQFSLLLLISSVLFGGFFVSLESLLPWLRGFAFILPITHGIIALQATMLRGEFPPLWSLAALGAMAVLLFLISALLFRRQMRRR